MYLKHKENIMLCMGFIKELPEEERNLISSIYRF